MSKSVFGAAFDRVVVINLDRRSDRMSRVHDQLSALGVAYQRHSAVDGQDPKVAADWQRYLRTKPQDPPLWREVKDWQDFYLGDKPHAARVAFFERQNASRDSGSMGAFPLHAASD